MRRSVVILACLVVACAASAATPAAMSVQVRNGQLRATPSFLGQVVAPLAYGDQVQIVQQEGPWMKVTAPGMKSGWIHSSALTKKKIVMQAGAADVEKAASGEELALASKGFNSDVEAEFKAQNKDIDFAWVDRMEKYKVDAEEMKEFLEEGGVKAEGGAQ
jgi:uncharacterized protein YgiM (DUF1202 family)